MSSVDVFDVLSARRIGEWFPIHAPYNGTE